ncbi:MAG: hypothetical protein HYW34_03120 [Candidatus Brennerbacteria bacterium]|nr:hypothetical protein [Candidatus Brennerbacteria bacterium]
MDKSSFMKLIIVGVLIIFLAVLVFVWRGGSNQALQAPAGETSLTVQPTPFVQSFDAAQNKPGTSVQKTQLAAPKTQSGVKILTPQENNKWSINKSHQINWSKEAGETGAIQLISADSRELIGWILASTGVKQNYFSWDTRDVFLNRQAGVKTNLKTGEYRIKLVFDSRFAPVESAVFSIIAESEQESITPVVRLKNETIVPSSVSVFSGQKIIFINNDSIKQIISSQTIPGFELLPNGGIYILDTSKISAGTHFYSSNIYSFRAPGTLIVK